MDYEHDDRRAADVPGASGAEGSGLPAGREPLDAGSPSSRSPEVRAFDPDAGSSLGPSDVTASGQADDLFDAMFLTGGMRPPIFAAVDHDLGFPPPQGPDLASAFLAALDAIDDRRFVTPVPEEPPAAHAPVEPASGEPAYELRPQSQLELESEARPEAVGETVSEAAPVTVEGAEPLPWDTAARVPAEETWAFASYLESAADLQARASATIAESAAVAESVTVAESATVAESTTVAESAGEIEEFASASAIEETAHLLDVEALDALEDEADEAAALTHEAVSAEEDVEESAYVEDNEPIDEAAYFGAGRTDDSESLEEEFAEELKEEDVMAFAAASLDAAPDDAAPDDAGAPAAYAAPVAAASVAAADVDEDADAAAEAEALALALAEAEAELEAAGVEPTFDITPDDDDFELEPAIGMEPIEAAPMAFDGPDAFAPVPVASAEPEPEPEPESDELEDLQDFVVFSLGDMRCVVPIRNVVEVGRIPDAAPVPNAPAWLYGLGNLRGQVLSLIDLRALFGVGRIKASAGRMVVLRGDSDDITAGVMVDQVHQIVALSPSRFKETPTELPLPDRSTEYVWGACDYGNFTMIGLDVDGVLGVENMTEETV